MAKLELRSGIEENDPPRFTHPRRLVSSLAGQAFLGRRDFCTSGNHDEATWPPETISRARSAIRRAVEPLVAPVLAGAKEREIAG